MKFYNAEGDLQNDALQDYINFAIKDEKKARSAYEQCNDKLKNAENQCDFIHEAFKCFYDHAKTEIELGASNAENLDRSAITLLRLDEIDDEDEIREDINESMVEVVELMP